MTRPLPSQTLRRNKWTPRPLHERDLSLKATEVVVHAEYTITPEPKVVPDENRIAFSKAMDETLEGLPFSYLHNPTKTHLYRDSDLSRWWGTYENRQVYGYCGYGIRMTEANFGDPEQDELCKRCLKSRALRGLPDLADVIPDYSGSAMSP